MTSKIDIVSRFAKWQNKLLDLSLRNPLLSLRSNQGLSIFYPTPIDLAKEIYSENAELLVIAKPLSLLGRENFNYLLENQEQEIIDKEKQDQDQNQDKNLQQIISQAITSETNVSKNRIRLNFSKLTNEEKDFIFKWSIKTKSRIKKKILLVDYEADLQSRLAKMERTNRGKEEESGIHVLFLSIGMIKWIDENKGSRSGPLFLLPVKLTRKNTRTDFTLQKHSDDVVLNPALEQVLSKQYNVDWSELKASLDEEKIDFEECFDLAKKAIASNNGFLEIIEEAKLCLLSYAKHTLWNDLAQNYQKMSNHLVIQKIINPEVIINNSDSNLSDLEWDKLDKLLPPDKLFLPLPADASQIRAVAMVDSGANLVIQGPPGTGKSQTIANIIAHLLAKGKRVLFVAEKLTALSVVHKRMIDLGLGDFCLELHTQNNSKTKILNELQNSLSVMQTPQISGFKEASGRLSQMRKFLNEGLNALHEEYPNGLSVFNAIGKLAQSSEVKLIPNLFFDNVLEEHVDEVLNRKRIGLNYAQAFGLMPTEANIFNSWIEGNFNEEIWGKLRSIKIKIDNCKNLNQRVNYFKNNLTISNWLDLMKVSQLNQKVKSIPGKWQDEVAYIKPIYEKFKEKDQEFAKIWADYKEVFKKKVLNTDNQFWNKGIQSNDGIINKVSSFLWYQKAKQYLNKKPLQSDIYKISKNIDKLKFLYSELEILAKELIHIVPSNEIWNKSGAKFSTILRWVEEVVSWHNELIKISPENRDNKLDITHEECERMSLPYMELSSELKSIESIILKEFNGVSFNDIELDNLELMIQKFLNSQALWPSWVALNQYRNEAMNNSLGALVEAIENKDYDWREVDKGLDKSYYYSFVNAARMRNPQWVMVQGRHREKAIEQFSKEISKMDKLTKDYIVSEMAKKMREEPIDSWRDTIILKKELMKKARHMPTRVLIKNMPNLLPVLKPCLLMSPLSVAEYLAHDTKDFDVVIFDEASQIPTEEAVSAISRAKQVVIVGDPKQMPPSKMFVSEDYDDEGNELDSILTEALGSSFPSVLLNWHYRSKHEHLIAFSNQRYYRGELITFPNPENNGQSKKGLFVHEVNGIYDRGGSGTNYEEAEAVVNALENHVLNSKDSVGVVTFNQKQQSLIEALWDKKLSSNPLLEDKVQQLPESINIKNLENIQGDERDVIYFSTTFGRDSKNRFPMNFGPLGQLGGERRLNVAITRARKRMDIFTSFKPSDIDLSRITHQGVRDLRDWLAFASGQNVETMLSPSLGLPDSPFELAVIKALKDKGWLVQPQVGCSGYKIDIAIIDPKNKNRYLAGIECDGATYHSFKTARDRDKQRQEILEGLGWNILRIWSTEWFENSERELSRIDNELKKLLNPLDS